MKKLYITKKYMVLLGEKCDPREHSHFMKHIAIGLNGDIQAMIDGKVITCAGIIIDSKVNHTFLDNKTELMLYFIPDGGDLAFEMKDKVLKNDRYKKISEQRVDKIRSLFKAQSDRKSIDFISMMNLSGIDPYQVHIHNKTVCDLLQIIEKAPSEDLNRKRIAQMCAISEGRLSHLFREVTGVTLQNYLMLCKLSRAVQKIFVGESITEACMNAGFSSPSHFADTMRNWYGLSMKQDARDVEVIYLMEDEK